MINTLDDARTHVCELTSGRRTINEIDSLMLYYKEKIIQESPHGKEIYNKELEKLKIEKNDIDMINGDFAIGLDKLLIDIVNVRALIYAFENSSSAENLIKENMIMQQWLTGSIYLIVSNFGKLLSEDNRDTSLRNLWQDVSGKLKESQGCKEYEINALNKIFNKKNGIFNNKKSPVLKFRNKSISHNEKVLSFTWDEFDRELFILIRAWSILVSWASMFGIFNPFIDDSNIFKGLESVFSKAEQKNILELRNNYIDKVINACRTHVSTGEIDNGAIAIRDSISVNISMG